MKICQKETLIYRTKYNLRLQNDVLKFAEIFSSEDYLFTKFGNYS